MLILEFLGEGVDRPAARPDAAAGVSSELDIVKDNSDVIISMRERFGIVLIRGRWNCKRAQNLLGENIVLSKVT
jgi:hypothetical protein